MQRSPEGAYITSLGVEQVCVNCILLVGELRHDALSSAPLAWLKNLSPLQNRELSGGVAAGAQAVQILVSTILLGKVLGSVLGGSKARNWKESRACNDSLNLWFPAARGNRPTAYLRRVMSRPVSGGFLLVALSIAVWSDDTVTPGHRLPPLGAHVATPGAPLCGARPAAALFMHLPWRVWPKMHTVVRASFVFLGAFGLTCMRPWSSARQQAVAAAFVCGRFPRFGSFIFSFCFSSIVILHRCVGKAVFLRRCVGWARFAYIGFQFLFLLHESRDASPR